MTLEEIANNYQPDQHAANAVRQANVLLLVGISGAGKDTIQSQLLAMRGYHRIVTHTTRPPRENNGLLELNGREYHFVTYDEMQRMLEEHQLIEVNHYGVHYYGVSINELYRANEGGNVAISNIDVNGVRAFRSLADTVRALFIIPPDYTTWRERLARRYATEDEFTREFPSRRDTAIDELEHALELPYYHFIINDDLIRAVRVVDEIAHRREQFTQQDDEARLKARALLQALKLQQ